MFSLAFPAFDPAFWNAMAQLFTLLGVIVSGILSYLNRRELHRNSIVTTKTAELVNGHLTKAIDDLAIANKTIADRSSNG